ncbi:uncharacterized protein FIBRA_04234 [Fibroporia radiculosa]|uniref:Uncharacterized protein n=1 Tax=Fibroporia radiculosa TaxID=599839 RepID=J4IA22_9APHY|nr:uncharacterized protein FIBRA_04234 [Fibroporia radiculosa]CCM02156.1 predicted protein [Fibroporia radiculosa]
MDAVASATVEILFGSDAPEIVNISHPRPVVWKDVMAAVNGGLGKDLPFAPLDEWVRDVGSVAEGASANDLATIPAIKLLEYYRSIAMLERKAREEQLREIEVGGLPVFQTSRAVKISPTLAALKPLGADDARAWVGHWRSKGFVA